MNILLISHFFPPHKGGVETATYYTAKYLAKLGHNVIVLTSKTKNFKSLEKGNLDFKLYRYKSYSFPEIRGFTQSSSLGLSPKAIINLPKIIKKHKIQIIHAKGQFFPISFITAFLNKLIFKKPMFISIEGRLKFGITGIIENIFDLIITRHLYQKLEKIICVSNSLKNRLLNYKIDPDKLEVVPNGVDLEIYSNGSGKKQNYFDFYFPNQKGSKKVVFVGRFSRQKGLEYLLKAIPKVANKVRNVHFFLLGSGEGDNLEKYLRHLAKELKISEVITFLKTVHLDSPLENHITIDQHFKEIANFYSSADVFCLPSVHEGFPLTIVEALSTGLVIVASRVEGIPEVIINGENGFLSKPKDVSELSSNLIKALNLSTEEREKIRNQNLKKVRHGYSWEIIAKKLEKFYRNCLK